MIYVCYLMSGTWYASEVYDLDDDAIRDNIQTMVNEGTIVAIVDDLESLYQLGAREVKIVEDEDV